MNDPMTFATILMAIATVVMAIATIVVARYAKASHALAKAVEQSQKDYQASQEKLLQGMVIAMALSGPGFCEGIDQFKRYFAKRDELFR
jgi:hypothetical protein